MSKLLTIKEWAEDDRPREKLLDKGKDYLSDAELLAIIIGCGSRSESAVDLSKRILSESENLLHELGRKKIDDLRKIKGIGTAKGVSIIAALELGKRYKLSEVLFRQKISSSRDVFNLFYPVLSDKPHEEFWVAYLNKANKIITRELISKGGIDGTVIDVKIIIKKAIECLATSMVLSHNHPSGNLKPSDADIKITNKIKQAALYFDCQILDHVIVGDTTYFSFLDQEML